MLKLFFFYSILFIPILAHTQFTDKDKEILRIELSKRINELRISKGLKPLLSNDTLKSAAIFHSEYMVKQGILTHDEKQSKYATPKKRVEAFDGKDFELVGENALYSTPQDFPLNKKAILALADEMFNSWKNSPGHYANMTEPEYVYGDLGFKEDPVKRIVYATQVFGTKGIVVADQLSSNSFGLIKASSDCEKEYGAFSNIILNLGNDMEIEGNEVILYYHDINYFNKIFSNPNDGIAVDFVSRDQFQCGIPNQLDLSPVYDGIMLKPFYKAEMLSNNKAESDYRIITKVGNIPENMLDKGYSPSMILIKNGKACKYIYPAFVPREDYTLRPIEPIITDEASMKLTETGIESSQTLEYDFKTNITSAIEFPLIESKKQKIHSIQIKSYSSVEGDSINNARLHNSRALTIKKHLNSRLNISDSLFTIDARENWSKMNFQLNYFMRDDLAILSHDSLKNHLITRDNSLPWDSLLFSQRKATATINYAGEYNSESSEISLAEFNLRTAVATDNVALARKALYVMFEIMDYDPGLLFESQIVEFFKTHPEAVGNYSALLSENYEYDVYAVTVFIHHWLDRKNELDDASLFNLLYLYTLVGSYLLDNWDVPAERLSNVIHPSKILALSPDNMTDELILNLHLTFIQYFGQINDAENISKSFYFIADYFQKSALRPEDDVDLALFFNNWSMYDMTIKHLSSQFEQNKLNEDGLFVLAETMNFTNYKDESGIYIEVQQKALEINKTRWCEWLKNDFQVMRNYQIKRKYCEACE